MGMTHTRDETGNAERPHALPLPFHRLARASARYRWWKPLIVGIIAAAIYALMLVAALLTVAVVSVFEPGVEAVMADFTRDSEIDLTDPFTFTFTMISVILMLPALLIATRILGVQRVGSLSSVTGRLRWGWLLRCVGLGAAVFAAAYLITFVVAAVRGEATAPRFDDPQLPVLLVLALLFVPIQAAAEEYVFRGYLMQTIGGWLRHPAFAILLPVPFFVMGHDYELVGMIDIAAFAIAAGWLTWRTGGLEAAIGLHIVNNVAIFALGTVGLVDPNATDLGPTDLVFSLAVVLTATMVLLAAARRHDIARVSEVRADQQDPSVGAPTPS